MNQPIESATRVDVQPANATFRRDVLRGLARTPKRLSSKYLYDARGSQLFDDVCLQPEYYPTRTELAIMEASAGEMGAAVGPQATLIEYGSGTSLKTRLLLDALDDPQTYVPVDISREHLERAAQLIDEDYPGLDVRPVPGDFTHDFDLPDDVERARRRSVYFPGSTIGNFTPRQAARALPPPAGRPAPAADSPPVRRRRRAVAGRRSGEGSRPSAGGLQRRGRRDGGVQPQPARANES